MASPPPRCHDTYLPFAVCVAGQSSPNQDGIYHVRLPGRGLKAAISQGSLQRRAASRCSSFPTAPNLLHLCHRHLFISTTALLSHGHRRPCGPPPQTDPLRFLSSSRSPFSLIMLFLFGLKRFLSAFFRGPQREIEVLVLQRR